MAVLSLERQWVILISDREHHIDLSLENKALHNLYRVKIDGVLHIEEKNRDLAELWGDYTLEVEGSQFTLRLFKKGILGLATDCELLFGEDLISPEEEYAIPARPEISSSPAHAKLGDGDKRMYPKLPPSCPACGAPVTMQNANWVGPMNAACSSCGSTIEVEWREL